MTKLRADILTAFNGGEITPELSGRVDKDELKFGARYMSNFLPEHQGGVRKWYGTTKVDTVPVNVASGNYRLIPFDGASEPISLLFCAGNVYAVSSDGIFRQSFQVSPSQIYNASYLQINDIIYFANGVSRPFQIQYYGIVDGLHVFNFLDSVVKEEPFFPLNWRGNYTGGLRSTGYSGTITLTAVTSGTEYYLRLPAKLQSVGAGINVLFENTIDECISAGDSLEASEVNMGTTKLQLVRIRDGVETVLLSSDIGNAETVQEV